MRFAAYSEKIKFFLTVLRQTVPGQSIMINIWINQIPDRYLRQMKQREYGMNKKRKPQKRQKRIRRALRAALCSLLLIAIAFCIRKLTIATGRRLPDSMPRQPIAEAPAPGGIIHAESSPGSLGSSVSGPTQPDNASGSGGSPQPDSPDGSSLPDSVGGPDGSPQPDSPDGSSLPDSAGGPSHALSNGQIDISTLDNAELNWGPGSQMDDRNRPVAAVSYQEKYGAYNADFLVADSDKLYLTFDEGYENGCTPAILDTLKAKNVSAVFFVTYPFAKNHPDLVRRILDEGHALGNHSVNHPANGLPSETVEEQQKEVIDLHNFIKENFNYEMRLFRYPSGKFSAQSLGIVSNCNYKSVFWSFAHLDYDTANQPDPTEALNRMVGKLHPGAIYLLHAVSRTNTEVLGAFIDYARAAGYEFALYD